MNDSSYNYDDISVILNDLKLYATKMLYVNVISPIYILAVFLLKYILKIPFTLISNLFYSVIIIAIFIITYLFVRECVDRIKFLKQKRSELGLDFNDNNNILSSSPKNRFLNTVNSYMIMHTVFFILAMFFLWQ